MLAHSFPQSKNVNLNKQQEKIQWIHFEIVFKWHLPTRYNTRLLSCYLTNIIIIAVYTLIHYRPAIQPANELYFNVK